MTVNEVRADRLVLLGIEAMKPVMDPLREALRDRGLPSAYFDLDDDNICVGEIIREADILYCPGALRMDASLFDQARRLRALISIYTGTDGFDEAAATARNILVANGQAPENSESLAEATILMMLAALYDLDGAERALRSDTSEPPRRHPLMLRGKKVGLVGFGQIARAVASRLESWDVHFLIATPRPRPPLPESARVVSLDDLLREADIVCILAPLSPDTVNLIDRERLASTKPGSIFVNMSRGGLVDESALHDLAAAGHFGAIALDVFATEPLPQASPLRDLTNAILTPHALGHTKESMEGLIKAGLDNILSVVEGRVPPYVRNPEVLPGWLEKWSCLSPAARPPSAVPSPRKLPRDAEHQTLDGSIKA